VESAILAVALVLALVVETMKELALGGGEGDVCSSSTIESILLLSSSLFHF
jgi:hypothetical protein